MPYLNRSCIARLFFIAVGEMVVIGIAQRLPTGVNDVSADADGSEHFLCSVGTVPPTLDDDAHLGGCLIAGIDDTNLVIGHMHLRNLRKIILQGFAEGA